jgi:hypothetical protein
MAKFSGNFRISLIVLAVGFILLVPLVAMQITEEVDWSAVDFVVAGALLLGAGFHMNWLQGRQKMPNTK